MLILGLLLACRTEAPEPEPVAPASVKGSAAALEGPYGIALGDWTGELATLGGPLRFRLRITGNCQVELLHGAETTPTFSQCEDHSLSVRFPPYLGSLTARISEDGESLRGRWDYPRDGLWHHLDFVGSAGPGTPAEPAPEGAPSQISLRVGSRPAQMRLEPGSPGVVGSVLFPAKDEAQLEGGWTDEGLELSRFDGSRALLYRLGPGPEGRFAGQKWSADEPGVPIVEAEFADLGDPWARVPLGEVDISGLSAQRIGGAVEPVPSTGPRIVFLGDTTCPGCNELEPVMEGLSKEFPEVQVIGLYTGVGGSPGKSDRQLRQLRDRYRVTHPMYRLDSVAPFFTKGMAWPTVLFLAPDGRVSAAFSGSRSTAMGPEHSAMVERFRAEAGRLRGLGR